MIVAVLKSLFYTKTEIATSNTLSQNFGSGLFDFFFFIRLF